MGLKICTVYDSKTEAYLPPTFWLAKGQAIRAFASAVNGPVDKSDFSKYPGDYTLFEIGEWDERAGTITMHSAKISYGTALEWKESPSAPAPLFDQAGIRTNTPRPPFRIDPERDEEIRELGGPGFTTERKKVQ